MRRETESCHLLGLEDLLAPVEPAFRADPVRHYPVPAIAAFDEGGNSQTHVRRAAFASPCPRYSSLRQSHSRHLKKWINLIKITKATLTAF